MSEFKIVEDTALANSIELLAQAVDSLRIVTDFVRKMVVTPPAIQPNINVHVPEISPPDIIVQAAEVSIPPPTYEMPPLNIQIPEEKPKKLSIHRNSDGYIDYVTEGEV